MRIAQCLEYPIQQHGGTEVLVRELIHGLHERHEIVLVSPDDQTSLQRSSVSPLLFRHLPWDPARNSRHAGRNLARQLREAGVEVAHFHFGGNFGWGSRVPEGSPLPFAARLGIRVFSTVHSVVSLLSGFCGPQKPTWIKLALLPGAWLGKMDLLWHVEREIAVSQHDYAKLRRWYAPLRRRLSWIYHSRLLREEINAGLVAPREPFVLSVGQLAPRKGQIFLVEAFSRIASRFPEWRLVLVGSSEPEYERELRRRVARAGLAGRVELVGPRDDVPHWIRRCGLYVQPSLQEALGLALQEAMARGCACVGTRAGGMPELLTPGSGGLVPPGDPEALARAMDDLLANPRLRGSMGEAAAKSIQERGMHREAMIQKYMALYEPAG